MYSKIFMVLILSVVSLIAHTEPMRGGEAQILNQEISEVGNSSVSVNGPIYVVSNASVEAINFPNLKFVNGPIYITYNSSLEVTNFFQDMYVNGPIYYFMNKNK